MLAAKTTDGFSEGLWIAMTRVRGVAQKNSPTALSRAQTSEHLIISGLLRTMRCICSAKLLRHILYGTPGQTSPASAASVLPLSRLEQQLFPELSSYEDGSPVALAPKLTFHRNMNAADGTCLGSCRVLLRAMSFSCFVALLSFSLITTARPPTPASVARNLTNNPPSSIRHLRPLTISSSV